MSCAWSCIYNQRNLYTKVYSKLIKGQTKKSTIKYRNILFSTITHLVRVYSLSPECRFMAENVPIQPLNRLSLPIFHVTKSGLKKRHKKFSWRKLTCVQHKTTEHLLQSHDFNSPEYFPSKITKDNKAEFWFLFPASVIFIYCFSEYKPNILNVFFFFFK